VLARERKQLLALLRRQLPPDVPGRQRKRDGRGALESGQTRHDPILAESGPIPSGSAVYGFGGFGGFGAGGVGACWSSFEGLGGLGGFGWS
jgi:hypothetical protein